MSNQAALSHVSEVWSNVLRVKVNVIFTQNSNKNVLDVVVCIFLLCEFECFTFVFCIHALRKVRLACI